MTGWTRRKVLLAGGAGVAVMGAGGLGVGTSMAGPSVVEAVVRDHLAPTPVPQEALDAFTAEFVKGAKSRDMVKLAAARAQGVLFPERLGAFRAKYERHIITRFLTSTNFFELAEPQGPDIAYRGEAHACANPFANFDLPA